MRPLAALAFALAFAPQDEGLRIRGLRHPALSPDGTRLCFSYHGDLWICPAEGGRAERLTSDTGDEQKPAWAPDGKSIAFSSDSGGDRDVFVLTLADKTVRQVTYHSAEDDKPDWSPDGRWIAFHSAREKNVNLPVDDPVNDVWIAPAAGGTARRLTYFRGENPAWSPDGKWIAFDAYAGGYADGQHDAFIVRAEGGTPAAIATGDDDTRKPAWKGDSLYLSHEASMRPGHNLWRTKREGGVLVQVTGFERDHATWPATSPGTDLVVFEHDFGLWAVSLKGRGKPFELEITIAKDALPTAGEGTTRRMRAGALRPAWSPDGAAILVELEGDVWSIAADGSKTEPVARSIHEELSPAWGADGPVFLRGAYGGGRHVAVDGKTLTPREGSYTRIAACGKTVALERETGEEVDIVALRDGKLIDVACEPHVIETSPAFVDDDTIAYAAVVHRGGQATSRVMKVKLGGKPERIFEKEGYLEDLAVAPDGEKLAFSWRLDYRGSPNVWILDEDGPREFPDRRASRFQPTWAPDGTLLACVESRVRDYRFAVQDPGARLVVHDAADPSQELRLSYDVRKTQTRSEENLHLFDFVWGRYHRDYYDPFNHGADWAAVRARYAPLVSDSRTAAERHDLLNRMIDELRSSHVALHPARRRAGDVTFAIGADLEPLEDGTLKIRAIEADGPADDAGLKAGEVIVKVGDAELRAGLDFDRLMTAPPKPGPVDVPLRVKDAAGEARDVTIDPIEGPKLRELKFQNLVQRRKKRVAERGGGRLAYHPIRFMNDGEVKALEAAIKDEFPDAEALVLDVRDGFGGMAHKPILQVLDSTAPERLNKNPACSIRYRSGQSDLDTYGRFSSRRRAAHWDRPVIMIQNEVSRSDKEILAYTFRHLGIGYLVGGPTSGGVIGGSDALLPDGSTITVSVQGWFTTDGRNLEGSGVKPDFLVPIAPEDWAAGRDPQLDRAIDLLLAQLDGKIPALERK